MFIFKQTGISWTLARGINDYYHLPRLFKHSPEMGL